MPKARALQLRDPGRRSARRSLGAAVLGRERIAVAAAGVARRGVGLLRGPPRCQLRQRGLQRAHARALLLLLRQPLALRAAASVSGWAQGNARRCALELRRTRSASTSASRARSASRSCSTMRVCADSVRDASAYLRRREAASSAHAAVPSVRAAPRGALASAAASRLHAGTPRRPSMRAAGARSREKPGAERGRRVAGDQTSVEQVSPARAFRHTSNARSDGFQLQAYLGICTQRGGCGVAAHSRGPGRAAQGVQHRPQGAAALASVSCNAQATSRPDARACAAPLRQSAQMRSRRVHAAAPAVAARRVAARLPVALTRARRLLRACVARRRLFTRR